MDEALRAIWAERDRRALEERGGEKYWKFLNTFKRLEKPSQEQQGGKQKGDSIKKVGKIMRAVRAGVWAYIGVRKAVRRSVEGGVGGGVGGGGGRRWVHIGSL